MKLLNIILTVGSLFLATSSFAEQTEPTVHGPRVGFENQSKKQSQWEVVKIDNHTFLNYSRYPFSDIELRDAVVCHNSNRGSAYLGYGDSEVELRSVLTVLIKRADKTFVGASTCLAAKDFVLKYPSVLSEGFYKTLVGLSKY